MNDDTPTAFSRVRAFFRLATAERDGQQCAWIQSENTLRFERAHDGVEAIELDLSGTRIHIARGVRIGRGTRIALLGGEVRIARGCVIGEAVELRATTLIEVGESCVVEDFVQLQSDAAALTLSASVRVERFTRLWAHSGSIVIGAQCTIGASNTWIGTGEGIQVAAHCDFTHAVTLDSAGGRIEMKTRSGVGPNSVLYGHGGLRIGSNVAIAGLTMLVPGNHRIDRLDIPIRAQGIENKPIEVGDDVWIGANVVVLAGARLGAGCVVAAGAVVRGDIAARSIVGGIPARVIATREGGAASLSPP